MTRFVGCIDLHEGQVKQIVGGTLTENEADTPKVNFVSEFSPRYYAELYKTHNVIGSHVIKLGPHNEEAAKESLRSSPGFLQVGGGINDTNCEEWLNNASKVIITSWLFSKDAKFQLENLKKVSALCGKDRLVVDLSCRKTKDNKWVVAMNKWQTLTNLELNEDTFKDLSKYTDEFLIHAADVEGLCKGIDEELVKALFDWTANLKPELKIVYAGGAKSVEDLQLVDKLSNGKVDLTYGSALDIFGGKLVTFKECCDWNSLLPRK